MIGYRVVQIAKEYKHAFLSEYKRVMTVRLGLKNLRDRDHEELFSEALNAMRALELDLNLFFSAPELRQHGGAGDRRRETR
ncbi:hypothetical protein F4824DRAFT_449989 [Ustulina deusta]|nr:hypothetical protein F4824DRAFT_449989 [Ustulina deusta]